jgi:hypothetical protein
MEEADKSCSHSVDVSSPYKRIAELSQSFLYLSVTVYSVTVSRGHKEPVRVYRLAGRYDNFIP